MKELRYDDLLATAGVTHNDVMFQILDLSTSWIFTGKKIDKNHRQRPFADAMLDNDLIEIHLRLAVSHDGNRWAMRKERGGKSIGYGRDPFLSAAQDIAEKLVRDANRKNES